MSTTLLGKVFCDSNGHFVIAQPPNPPLILWIAATLLKFVFNKGELGLFLDLLAFGALFTWAWQEIFEGVNYFRRGLGSIVLIALIASKILAGSHAI
jgi:hypothetical protein